MVEFKADIANLSLYNIGLTKSAILSFPTTAEQVQKTLRSIGVTDPQWEIIVLDYSIGIKGVARALGQYTHIDELNYLASRLNELDPEELMKFTAAVEHGEYANSAEDLINLTYNLNHYEYYPVYNAEEYGFWLVDELMTLQLPEQARDYFDFEAYGEATAINEGGTFTSQGYMLAGAEPFKRFITASTSRSSTRCSSTPSRRKSLCPGSAEAGTAPSISAHEGAFFMLTFCNRKEMIF